MQIRYRMARYVGFVLYPYTSLQTGEFHRLWNISKQQLIIKVRKGPAMKSDAEKRACERCNHAATFAVSYFNQEPSFYVQTLNHGLYGMCFKSSLFLQPGAFLFIRAIKFNPNGSCKYSSEGLRSVTLAEVKWCSEVPGDNASQYIVGVKYFAPPC